MNKLKIRISCQAPHKKWERGENGLWYSREWLPKEKQDYEKYVLYRAEDAC